MPRFSNNNNTYTYPNNITIIGHRILYANLAGLLMHCPGLVVKWEYEDLPEYIQSICGASVEGCFLLLLATGTYNVGYHFYVKLDKARKDNTNRIGHLTTHNKQEQHRHKFFIKAYILIIAILLPIWYFSFIIFSILGDATYRKMTGNGNPSVGILQAGFSDARSNIMAQITYEGYVGTIVRFTFSVLCLLSSILVYIFKGGGSTLLLEKKSYHHATPTTKSGKKNGGGRFRILSCLLIGYGIALYRLNLLEWYTPVAQVCVAYIGTFNVKEQKNIGLYDRKSTLNVNHSLRDKQQQHQEQKSSVIRAANNNFRPNIIFLQHESLSGAIMLKTQEGIDATPFFHDKMHNDTNFYVFEKTHTGSGNTIDAMPALLTGCLPHTLEGVDWVRSPGRSIGYDFSLNGYATASFSSTAHGPSLKYENGNYYMLYDLLVGGMDTVKEPLSMGYRMENADAVDDRKILPLIEEWLSQLNATQMNDEGKPTTSKQQRKPFYAQWYQTNAHYPYFKDDEIPSSSNRYFDALKTVDLTLKGLFEILEKTNHLHDTIIIGSGDHGEDPFKDAYVRVCSLNSNVLQTLSYIYYPKNLMSDPTVADRLRKNTQKMTHIVDMYPTILSIANDGHYNMLLHTPDDCITGLDLTADIPDDRVTFSINLGSSQVQPGRAKDNIPWQAQLWALSTMDPNGRELSLYYRRHKFDHPALKQGKDNLYILEYGDCLRNISISNLCMKEFDDENKQIFRNSIQWLKNSPLYHAGIKNSKVVETFADSTMNGTLDRVDDQAGNQHDSYSNLLLILRTLTGFSALGCIIQHKLKSYLARRVYT